MRHPFPHRLVIFTSTYYSLPTSLKMWHLRRKKETHANNNNNMPSFKEIMLARHRDIPHNPYISLLQYPVYYFFYGSMADPATLKRTLNLDETAKLHEAYIVGYTVARKDGRPALIDGPQGEVVKGYAYFVGSEAEGKKLREGHPKQCRVAPCLVHFLDGNKVTRISGNVFKHVGDAEAFLEPVDTQDWVHVSMESLGDS